MQALAKLLGNVERSGVFRLACEPDEVADAAAQAGLDVFRVDIARARGKPDLLARIAKVMRFPAHFGRNWDALNDCLTDDACVGAAGYVLVLEGGVEFAAKHASDLAAATDVLEAASGFWKDAGKPCWMFVQGGPTRLAAWPAGRR